MNHQREAYHCPGWAALPAVRVPSLDPLGLPPAGTEGIRRLPDVAASPPRLPELSSCANGLPT